MPVKSATDFLKDGDLSGFSDLLSTMAAKGGGRVMVAPAGGDWDAVRSEDLHSPIQPADAAAARSWCVLFDDIPECEAGTSAIAYVDPNSGQVAVRALSGPDHDRRVVTRVVGARFGATPRPVARPVLKAANDNAPSAKQTATQVRATPFVLIDPATIPKREWLFGRHYVRKYVTATFGAGGGGKSAHAVTEALSMATGRPLLDGPLQRPLRIWYINLEDPADEIARRFGAAAKHFSVTKDQIGDRLFTDSGRDQTFVVMRQDGRTTKVCEPVVQSIISEIKANKIDVLIVDPFVSTHEVEENDNTRIQQVAAQWVRIADEGNCAVELIHHVTKGNLEITADSGRGAGALKDKARSVRVINPMSEAEAGNAGLGKEEATSYFRVDFGKANLGKQGGKSAWHRFVSVALGNGKGILSMGDEIGVVESWQWPSAQSVVEDVPTELLAGIKARLGAGSYRESDQSGDWAGHLVGQLVGLDTSIPTEKKRVKRMLTAWIVSGELAVEMRPDSKRTLRKHIVPSASPPQ